MAKTVYLETMGCQMNVLDSELVMGELRRLGYHAVGDMMSADLVLLNTCSVRLHAEEKAYSKLGQLKKPKARNPNLIVGVIGCMAQRDPRAIVDKMPHVDLICGPGQLNHVAQLIDEVEQSRQRSFSLGTYQSRRCDPAERSALQFDTLEALDLSRSPQPGESVLQAYIRVQRGCDKFCTFCVVPFTRGPEQSRSPQAIVQEARMLADRGAREITLLGQTVNSYAHMESGRRVLLSDLLYRLQAVDGIERIRFVTCHPGDFGDHILEAMRDLSKVCEYLHIPAQSGSDAVLRRMKRQYEVQAYADLLQRAREVVPGIQLAGDFIVGFSGETEAEFSETVRLVRQIRFKNIFCFKYSPRPGTAADRNLLDDVPLEVKRRRNNELLNVQEAIALAHNQQLVGQTVEILVEGYSKAAIKAQEAEQSRGQEVTWRRSNQLVGRTRGDQIVVFDGDYSLVGQLVRVRVSGATALTLHAEWDTPEPSQQGLNLAVIEP
jgi:tRNA-2-methylthio-N6-dimethylallyladenosine synthase